MRLFQTRVKYDQKDLFDQNELLQGRLIEKKFGKSFSEMHKRTNEQIYFAEV